MELLFVFNTILLGSIKNNQLKMTISILKRTILFCSFIAAGFIAEAQFTFAPTIGAGITGATLTAAPAVVSSSSVKTRSNSNLTENIGIGVGYQFSDFWTVNSGVFYQYIIGACRHIVEGAAAAGVTQRGEEGRIVGGRR